MTQEIIDIIDHNNNVIETATKTEVHQKGLRHRVSAVLLKRADGKYLFPTASKIKVEAGNLFHSAAGHVSSGESYEESAVRELEEECGVKAFRVKLLGSFWFEQDYPTRSEKERFEIFEAEYTESMGVVKLCREQVDEKWLNISELEKILTEQPSKISGPLKLTCKIIFNLK